MKAMIAFSQRDGDKLSQPLFVLEERYHINRIPEIGSYVIGPKSWYQRLNSEGIIKLEEGKKNEALLVATVMHDLSDQKQYPVIVLTTSVKKEAK